MGLDMIRTVRRVADGVGCPAPPAQWCMADEERSDWQENRNLGEQRPRNEQAELTEPPPGPPPPPPADSPPPADAGFPAGRSGSGIAPVRPLLGAIRSSTGEPVRAGRRARSAPVSLELRPGRLAAAARRKLGYGKAPGAKKSDRSLVLASAACPSSGVTAKICCSDLSTELMS